MVIMYKWFALRNQDGVIYSRQFWGDLLNGAEESLGLVNLMTHSQLDYRAQGRGDVWAL